MKMFRASVVAGVLLAVGPAVVRGRAETVAAMPAPAGYVDDYAGVVSGPAKAELEGLCREVHDKTKAQIFFVTIKTLDGEPVETFANELFHNWKIGEKKTDRGILLLLAIKDHKRRIEVGYGFEGILNDAKAGDIGREMVPALQASNYDEAARIGVRDVAKVIAADSNVTLDALGETDVSAAGAGDAPPPVTGEPESSAVKPMRIVLAIAPFAFFFFVFGLIVWKAVKRGVGFGGGGGGISGSDSGSSDSGSSSSDSFSGGDGGDSGGGGASGSW